MRETLLVHGNVNADVKADTTPLVQATADVVSSSNKGIGKLLNAFFGKWIAMSERSVALIQAQTEKDCADIKSGIKAYKVFAVLANVAIGALAMGVLQPLVNIQMRKLLNGGDNRNPAIVAQEKQMAMA